MTEGEPLPDQIALILRVVLPSELEALRRRHVSTAAEGVPAHVTLLYPFAAPSAIDASLRATIAAIAGRHELPSITLVERRAWPDVLYASVQPDEPVRSLQAELAAAFPRPLHDATAMPFVPHVTLVDGARVTDEAVLADQAWASLPATVPVEGLVLVGQRGGRWRIDERWPLGGRA
jgi:2'-5' RNA ligase